MQLRIYKAILSQTIIKKVYLIFKNLKRCLHYLAVAKKIVSAAAKYLKTVTNRVEIVGVHRL